MDLIHLSDLDWNSSGEDLISNFKKGDIVKAKLLEMNIEKRKSKFRDKTIN